MNILRRLAGVLTFITALGLAIAVTGYINTPFNTAKRVSKVGLSWLQPASLVSDDELLAQGISYQVKLVSLDFERRKSYTTLTLRKEADTPAPEKLWLQTYLFVLLDPQAGWASDPVEFDQPFKSGNTVTLTITAACHWCDQSSTPLDGYYARINLSTRSASDASRPRERIHDDLRTAIPVLVQNGRHSSTTRR